MTLLSDDLGRTLATAAYDGVEFPAAGLTTEGGHDSAKHQGYGQRGADIETTGPQPEAVRCRAVMQNGLRGWTGPELYPTQYQRLLRALRGTPEGFLTHPTRGVMTVHVDHFSEVVSETSRRGVVLELAFTEQRGESDLLEMAPPVASALDDAATAAAAADATRPTGARVSASLVEELAAARGFVESAGRSLAQARARVGSLLASIEARAADPAAAGASGHAYRAALAATRAAVLRYRAGALTSSGRSHVVLEEASLARIASDPRVFGDASRAAELARANVVLDPTRVPAGTVLVIP